MTLGTLIVALIAFGAIYWLIGMLPAGFEPFKGIARAAVIVVAILWLLSVALGATGIGDVQIFPVR
jgi:hypothetical protein